MWGPGVEGGIHPLHRSLRESPPLPFWVLVFAPVGLARRYHTIPHNSAKNRQPNLSEAARGLGRQCSKTKSSEALIFGLPTHLNIMNG